MAIFSRAKAKALPRKRHKRPGPVVRPHVVPDSVTPNE